MAEQKMNEKEWLNNNDLSLAIYNKKYKNGDETFDEFLNRVSGNNNTIKELISSKKFIFGGRILASRGITDRRVTYSNCFSGDTKIITDEGLLPLKQLVGKSIKVLSQNSWRDSTVKCFGTQPLKQLILQRGKSTKSIYVTENHLWFVQTNKGRILKQTVELTEGDIIPKELLKCYRTYKPSPFGVAHGLFMGDGEHGDRKQLRMNLCGDKKELISYFTPDTVGHSGDTMTICGMPRFFTQYPSLKESTSYLYGWLAGYFAADGSIDERGSCVICSTIRENLEFVQNVLCVLGIPTETIRQQIRVSNLTHTEGTIYILTLNKYYLNENFFILAKHKQRFIENFSQRNDEWKVKEVLDTDRIEEVYCAVVPETESFALEGGILTHNCYVIAPPEDNIESIFDCCKRLARTYSYGGGCGVDLSKLRPNGALVHNAAKTTCGPVGFMDLFSQTTGTIGQAGRRGALMLSLDVNHPDVEEFIDCKTDLNRVQYANISVRVNDNFMQAVEKNEDYILRWPCQDTFVDDLQKEEPCQAPYNELQTTLDSKGNIIGYYKRVKARELFNKLAKNNWDYAEPGILYWDRIEGYNIVENDPDFQYAGTNPCAEEPLPAGGSCLLGSLNLSEFVLFPFTERAQIDWDSLEEATRLAVRALNLVLIEGITLHPLEEQRESVSQWRQIGLGTLGLADCLIKLGIKYGSPESIRAINDIYRMIAIDSVLESLDMAKEYGCYPACKKELLVESSFIKALELPKNCLEEIKQYGLYNSQLLTCAPTGSIGTMFEASTGVEPQFALKYTRKTQSLEGKDTFFSVNARIVDLFLAARADETIEQLPDYFVTSADIAPIDRIAVQSVLQKYIDASISSTINLPKEATVEQVISIYMEAWKQGLKGVTVYRSGGKRDAVLTTEAPKPEVIPMTSAPKRPKKLIADFHSVKVKGEQFIVLVGLLENRPYEIFAFKPNIVLNLPQHEGEIVKKSKMHYAFASSMLEIKDLESLNDDIEERAATLYSSMLLRHGVPIKYIVKTAKKVNDNITSFSAAMCRVLSKYIPVEASGEKCPECGGNMIQEGGCSHCESCGYSRCS